MKRDRKRGKMQLSSLSKKRICLAGAMVVLAILMKILSVLFPRGWIGLILKGIVLVLMVLVIYILEILDKKNP